MKAKKSFSVFGIHGNESVSFRTVILQVPNFTDTNHVMKTMG